MGNTWKKGLTFFRMALVLGALLWTTPLMAATSQGPALEGDRQEPVSHSLEVAKARQESYVAAHEQTIKVPFMKVSDIKPGMTGYAKTVVEGQNIQTFPLKILGVMKDRGPSGDLILADFSGPIIERTGGIAHGMSGSPVYIDGKLVGAVAYGWGFTRSHLGMITPIEQMVALWNTSYTKDLPNPWPKDDRLIPLETPLMADGFDSAALAYLNEKLKDRHFKAYDTASTNKDEESQPLEPGSSVAATLVDGDLKLGAIGTVTYVDGTKIVAFGHPYLKEGKAGYFMHNSSIFTVVNSVESSFKLGSIGPTIGAITEDRGAGIAGVVGREPSYVPLSISILDTDLGRQRDAHVRVVKDSSLASSLVTTSVYSFLTKTMDRKGGGTATIRYSIVPEDPSLPKYERLDMFYSSRHVALEAIDDMYHIYDQLIHNPFVDYKVSHVDVSVDVTKEKKTAQIINASASSVIVSPGDTIEIKVHLHPYRGEDVTRSLMFIVPENQPYGTMTLEVRGGGEIPLPYLIEKQRLNLTDEVIRRLYVPKNFKEFFERLEGFKTNNQIVVEILSKDVSMVDDQDEVVKHAKLTGIEENPGPDYSISKVNPKAALEDKDTDKAYSVLNTEYIIKGDGQFEIQVLSPKEKEKALEKLIKQRMAEAKETAKKKEKHLIDFTKALEEAKKEAAKKFDEGKS